MARERLMTTGAGNAWNEFAGRAELAKALANTVAARLADAVKRRGTAFMAVSGGSTPAAFFRALSSEPVEWSKVVVTLIDERFVPPSSPRSNASLVAANLLQGAAVAARFAPLYREGFGVDEAARLDDAELRSLPWPLDVAILGMGTDGHTASFFPDAGNLATLLDPASRRIVLPVHAPSAGEPRLTLTAARIVEAGFVALHIEGADKRIAFDEAMRAGDKPVGAVVAMAPGPVQVFWAP
jgi:6-phosphogluconolactonase